MLFINTTNIMLIKLVYSVKNDLNTVENDIMDK